MISEPKPPQPPAPRYSQKKFPPYRFIPGVNAHPSRDPKGHSFAHVKIKPPVLPPEKWRENESYLYGVDLYNAVFWWESHEAWEDVWQTINKDSHYGQFLQGLIQISASFIKWHSGDILGVEKLFELGMMRLQSVEKAHLEFMGLNLPEHLAKLRAHFQKVLTLQDVTVDPILDYPFLVLKF